MMESKYLSHGEIHSQYVSLGLTVDFMLENSGPIRQFFSLGRDIVFVACGSSYWMSLSAHRSVKRLTGRRSYAIKAADVVLCPEEYTGLYDDPIFICPSRSGLTRELLDAVDILKEAYPGGKVFSFIEYKENDLSKKSDMHLNLHWANEESVCQTRSFSNLYAASVVLAAIVGQDETNIASLKEYLKAAPNLYAEHEPAIRGLADPKKIKSLATLGCGLQYGLVVEGAYIVIEMAEFAANYYHLLEYRHGPVVTTGEGAAIFICAGVSDEHEMKMAEEIRSTGALVYAVAPEDREWADRTFALGRDYGREAAALHFVFVMQSFAHHFSVARGRNPDSPGKLVRYINYP